MRKLMMTVALSVSVSSGAMAAAGSEGSRFDWDAWADEYFVEADQCRPSEYAQALKLVREAEDRFNAGEVSFDELLCSAELEEAVRYIEDHCGAGMSKGGDFSGQLMHGFDRTRDPVACQGLVEQGAFHGCRDGGALIGGATYAATGALLPGPRYVATAAGATFGCALNGYRDAKGAWASNRGQGQPCEPK